MESTSTDQPLLGPRRFQFGLRDLFMLTSATAVGVSVVAVHPKSWGHAFLMAICVWIVAGLLAESRDLFHGFRNRSDLSADQRWGWRFAIFWRLGVVCLLLGYYVLHMLHDRQLLALAWPTDNAWPAEDTIRDAFLYLPLLIALTVTARPLQAESSPIRSGRPWTIAAAAFTLLGCVLLLSTDFIIGFGNSFIVWLLVLLSVIEATRRRWQSNGSPLFGWIAAVIAVAYCLYYWVVDRLVLVFLVHIATRGIDTAEPMWLSQDIIAVEAASRGFIWRSFAAVGILLINLGAVWQLRRRWRRGFGHRLCWAAVLAIGSVALLYHAFWLAGLGLARVSPCLARALPVGLGPRWLLPLLLVAVFATAAAYRAVAVRAESVDRDEPTGPSTRRVYYHRRRLTLWLVIAAVPMICGLERGINVIVQMRGVYGQSFSLGLTGGLDLMCRGFYYNTGPLALALLLTAIQSLLRSRSANPDRMSVDPAPLPIGQFCAVWLALFATILVAAPTLAGWGFALWLTQVHCVF